MVTIQTRGVDSETWETVRIDPETLTPVRNNAGDPLPVKHLKEGEELAWSAEFNTHQQYPRVQIVSNPDYVEYVDSPRVVGRTVSFDEFNVRRHGEVENAD